MRQPAHHHQSFELSDTPKMERIKAIFRPEPTYAPLEADQDEDNDGSTTEASESDEVEHNVSWIEYTIFLLLGIAMLWAWNMFLAAVPYFQKRFGGNAWILNHFQPAEISVSTLTNLSSMIVLSKMQKNASYPKRITAALIIAVVAFTLLALSTLVKASAQAYFAFLLVVVFGASLSTGLIQNGLFAYASGFGRSEYTQAIMTGQGIAGVLPPLVQIISVATIPANRPENLDGAAESPKSAFIYFLTAVVISVAALFAFLYLIHRTSRNQALISARKATVDPSSEGAALTGETPPELTERPSVPLTRLFLKLPFLSTAVFLCFAVTMVFPVFTASIFSTSGIDSAIFIPLAFLLWNLGDLLGRLINVFPQISLTHYPFALFCLAMARLSFVPLYFLCNIKGRGAYIQSDFFYLVVVQFLFGLTNGYLGSQCMMGAGDWVLPEEREAAGGFMGLMLIGGLTFGSLLSFLIGDI